MMKAEDNDNKRKHRRIKIDNLSKINEGSCTVINVSKEGLLLITDTEIPDKTVDIQLKIDGKWIDLTGTIMWLIVHPQTRLKSMGIFIIKAPPAYTGFVDNLYLEAVEK